MQNTPDGRIFISSPNGVKHIHTIENRAACNVQQHGIETPTFNFAGIPNHPNYRLGALAGSACDTLSVATQNPESEEGGQVRVFPNPANDILNIEIPQNAVSLYYKIYDILGRQMQSGALQNQISLKNLENGIYIFHIMDKNGGVYRTVRVVVQH
jgi:aminopeptidase YwaD